MYNVHYQPYWINNDELEHFGIKGMKWGIRRYQNPDGTLTEAGKQRYGSAEGFQNAREESKARRQKAAQIAIRTVTIAGTIIAMNLVRKTMTDIIIKDMASNLLKTKAVDDVLKKNGSIIAENIIKENVIKENIIREATIPEQFIKEDKIVEKIIKETRK